MQFGSSWDKAKAVMESWTGLISLCLALFLGARAVEIFESLESRESSLGSSKAEKFRKMNIDETALGSALLDFPRSGDIGGTRRN